MKLGATVAVGFFLVGCATPAQRHADLKRTIWTIGWTAEDRTYKIFSAFRELAPAVGIQPSAIRIVGARVPHVDAVSVGDHYFIVSQPLLEIDNRCLALGVIAHEIAHDVLGHAHARTNSAMALTVLAVGAGVMVPGGGYVVQAVGWIGMQAYSRGQETEADELAVTILRKAGKPTWMLRYALEFLQELVTPTATATWASSHPLIAERIASQPPIDPAEEAALCPSPEQRAQQIKAKL